MNNFELHEKAINLSDKLSKYQLARKVATQEELLTGLFYTLKVIAREQGMNTDSLVWYSKTLQHLQEGTK